MVFSPFIKQLSYISPDPGGGPLFLVWWGNLGAAWGCCFPPPARKDVAARGWGGKALGSLTSVALLLSYQSFAAMGSDLKQ